MNRKSAGILATLAAMIFCGLPGFLLGIFSVGRLILNGSPNTSPTLLSLVPIGASLFLLLIPISVGVFVTLKSWES
ncbi:MAG: hypothetical protein JETCAE01_01210 [Anaerolineaceae bacterium]|nr:MAG: hypothetical protein JETCAE01_01210 [Anaerolineaceae bacterium]